MWRNQKSAALIAWEDMMKNEEGKRSQVERRVKHPCQQLRDNGNACRSGKKTKLYKVFGDAEMYRGLWLKVYLCPRCSKETGV